MATFVFNGSGFPVSSIPELSSEMRCPFFRSRNQRKQGWVFFFRHVIALSLLMKFGEVFINGNCDTLLKCLCNLNVVHLKFKTPFFVHVHEVKKKNLVYLSFANEKLIIKVINDLYFDMKKNPQYVTAK